MRLKITKSPNSIAFYVIKDIKKNGKRTTKIVKKLGNEKDILKKSNGEDPIVWVKKYIEEL